MAKYSEVDVSPTRAMMFLKRNTGNFRQINKSRVLRYTSDMRNGNWLFCADPLRFSKDGILIDGQHRLRAVIESNVTVRFLVVEDLDEESSVAMDRGQPRTVKSWLSHSGVKNAVSIAAISRLCLMHRKGKWHHISWSAEYYSDADVIEFAEQHGDTMQSALHVAGVAEKAIYIPSTLIAAIMHEAAFPRKAEDVESCVWFCSRLADGINYQKTDAAYHLRERFFVPAGTKKHAAQRESSFMMRALATIAWNRTATSAPTKVLRFTPTGPGATEFPQNIEVAL